MRQNGILGYDINEKNCQISYYDEVQGEPVTMETSADNYQIPLSIGYLKGRWIYGREARSLEHAGEGEVVSDLLQRSIRREKVEIAGEKHDAVWLLAKFIGLTLENFQQIAYLTFTVPTVNEDIFQMLKSIGSYLGMEKECLSVQDHKESFCFYMFDQPKELWQYESALFHCDGQKIDAYMLRKLQPKDHQDQGLFVTVDEVAQAYLKEMDLLSPLMDPDQEKDADEKFTTFIQGVFEKKVVSSVYLTGEGFENNWYPNSLKVLCNGRRAFVGNNLYSKGACYAALRRSSHFSDGPVYLDQTKLTERISLHMRVHGRESWYPLVNWGTAWYEADGQWEILLEDTSDLEIHVESLAEEDLQVETISLKGLPERKNYSLRLKVDVMFLDERTCKIIFQDIGFGEFFQPTDFRVEKLIHLGGINGQLYSMS